MAKIITFLLCLLLGSNVYADGFYFGEWYCTFNPQYGYWSCEIRHPQCQNQTQYQTLSCPIHQSGAINQSRTYVCGTQGWGPWTTTSTNCTQDPPTCVSTTETRQVACAAGYTGFIQEQRSSTCSDPYGSPTWTTWSETSNTCMMTATNINNPTSPISPVSPMQSVTVTEQPSVQQETIVTSTDVSTETSQSPTVTNNSASNTTETPKTTQESSSNAAKTNTVTPQSNNTPAPISSPKQSENNASVSVPKGKDLVPGFGLVMSLDLINAPINFQQQQLEITIQYSQELPDGIRGNQEFITELITQGSATNLFDIGSKRWADLYSNYEVQPDY